MTGVDWRRCTIGIVSGDEVYRQGRLVFEKRENPSVPQAKPKSGKKNSYEVKKAQLSTEPSGGRDKGKAMS